MDALRQLVRVMLEWSRYAKLVPTPLVRGHSLDRAEEAVGMNTMWGIHNDALGAELVEKGFVSIGWEIPGLRTIGDDRARLKELVHQTYPHVKPGAIPVWTGVLYRFAFEMQEG